MLDSIMENRWYFILEGMLLVLLGALAIALPQLTTIGFGLFVGIFLLLAGCVMAFRAFKLKEEKGVFWPSIMAGTLSIIAGALMLRFLEQGIYILTLLLTIYLSFEGVSKIFLSYTLKPLKSWGYVLLSGIMTILLAAIIISGMPGIAEWTIGLLFGVHLLVSGFSMISIGIELEKTMHKKMGI